MGQKLTGGGIHRFSCLPIWFRVSAGRQAAGRCLDFRLGPGWMARSLTDLGNLEAEVGDAD
jgi:hypothetical protein